MVRSTGGLRASRPEETEGARFHVFVVDAHPERAMLGRRKFDVSAFMSVRDVKGAVSRVVGIPASRQLLYWRSRELKDHRTLEESGVHRAGATLLFDAQRADDSGEGCRVVVGGAPSPPRSSSGKSLSLEAVSSSALGGPDAALPPKLASSLLLARRALVLGSKAPELALDGTGGTYFLRSLDGRPVACFKPADEEPFCVNNPRHIVGPNGPSERAASASPSMRRGVRPGEAYLREVAAYLLDRSGGGLAGVPETTVVECRHPKFHHADRASRDKVGSFQVFVAHEGVAEDFGVDRLNTARLQAVAALDVRALNCDRNGANLLVPSKKPRDVDVVPIDHGYCLPEVLEIEWFDWCWIDWPQIAAPVCDELKRAIAAIDPERDAADLSDALGLRRESLRLSRAASELLKRGVAAGLTLRDVASLVVAPQTDLSAPSSDSARSSSAVSSIGARAKSRLAAAVARAADLAALALDEDRHPGRRKRPASPEHAFFLDDAKESSLVAAVAVLEPTETVVSFSPQPFEDDDDDLRRAREEKNMAEVERRLAASAPPQSKPVAILPRDPRGAFAESIAVSGSPRWVDGLPANVASRARPDLPCSPVAESPDDDLWTRLAVVPSPARRRQSATSRAAPAASTQRLRENTPLVRLHSCPALADALFSITQDDDDSAIPKPPPVDDDRTTSVDDDDHQADFDRHFFHFLHGILDDLVKWKQLAVTKTDVRLASF